MSSDQTVDPSTQNYKLTKYLNDAYHTQVSAVLTASDPVFPDSQRITFKRDTVGVTFHFVGSTLDSLQTVDMVASATGTKISITPNPANGSQGNVFSENSDGFSCADQSQVNSGVVVPPVQSQSRN